jgi:hypothetical protein
MTAFLSKSTCVIAGEVSQQKHISDLENVFGLVIALCPQTPKHIRGRLVTLY